VSRRRSRDGREGPAGEGRLCIGSLRAAGTARGTGRTGTGNPCNAETPPEKRCTSFQPSHGCQLS
jgi:hypothetical protein